MVPVFLYSCLNAYIFTDTQLRNKIVFFLFVNVFKDSTECMHTGILKSKDSKQIGQHFCIIRCTYIYERVHFCEGHVYYWGRFQNIGLPVPRLPHKLLSQCGCNTKGQTQRAFFVGLVGQFGLEYFTIIFSFKMYSSLTCVVQFRPCCQAWRLGPLDVTH